MKKYLLRLGVIVCSICGFVFMQWELAVESLAAAFDNNVEEIQYTGVAIDGDSTATSAVISTGVVGKERRRGRSQGVPVGFPGSVIPNPANIKPLADTDPPPSTRLTHGARFSTKAYAGHRQGNIDSCTQMWPDVQQREQ
jgi:hypothetical protein